MNKRGFGIDRVCLSSGTYVVVVEVGGTGNMSLSGIWKLSIQGGLASSHSKHPRACLTTSVRVYLIFRNRHEWMRN
jgi:hypothetical protein